MAITNQDIAEIAQESISAPAPEFVEVESFSTKLSDNFYEEGDRVKVGVYSKNVAAEFNAATQNYEDETGGGLEYKNVDLDKHFVSTFKITNGTTRYDMGKFIRDAAVAVTKQCNTFYYDSILAANYAGLGFTGAASTFDSDSVADLWQAAQDAEFSSERSLILTNPYYTSLLKDDSLKAWNQSGSDETLRRSIVRQLNDFEVMSSNTLASSAGAVGLENLTGFITDKSAMAVATGLPEIPDDESANMIMMITQMQAENGLTMQFRKHMQAATGDVFGTVEILTGVGVCDATRLLRIRSAA